VVIDAGCFTEVEPSARALFLSQLQNVTLCGGVHVIMPGGRGLAPEALLSAYDGWARDNVAHTRRRGTARKRAGLVLTRPDEANQAEAAAES
jgi:hypothetical protein